ncbi:MAG: hypothetical protein GX946_11955 [Oligosphaeraceae bacterium]|nr:hypothetical protein [Oligosphaeraceae bacterium]
MSGLFPFQRFSRTYRHLGRMRRILTVLFRNGFGFMFDKLRGLVPDSKFTGNWEELASSPVSLPERLRNVMSELGPTFVKAGQILAGRPDLIPHEYAEEFAKLQDQAPPFAFEIVRQIIEKELGAELEELFCEFDEEPISAASIAQGHRAKLHDGSEVFVKVRRPEIESTIKADLEILGFLADYLEKQNPEMRIWRPVKVVEEFSRRIEEELDLDLELANIECFARQFKGREGLLVPKVWPKLSSSMVLTMQFIRGCKATNLEELSKYDIDPLKVSRLGAELLLEQFFMHGFFHSDPHPGNIFFLPDNKICYVDFGQVGRVSAKERETFAGLLGCALRRNFRKAARLLLELVEYEQDPELEALERDLETFTDHYLYRAIEDIKTQSVLHEFYRLCTRHRIGLKPHIYLMLKAMGELDMLGRRLDPGFNIIRQLRPFLYRIFLRGLSPVKKGGHMLEHYEEIQDFLRLIPKQQKNFWQQCLNGKLLFNCRHLGLDRLEDFLKYGLDRICIALIQAGLLIASAVVIHANHPPMLFGLPLLALIGIGCSLILFVLMYLDMVRRR